MLPVNLEELNRPAQPIVALLHPLQHPLAVDDFLFWHACKLTVLCGDREGRARLLGDQGIPEPPKEELGIGVVVCSGQVHPDAQRKCTNLPCQKR